VDNWQTTEAPRTAARNTGECPLEEFAVFSID
jgi:hypothetical protein